MILKHSEALSAVNSFHFDFKSWTCNRSSVADGRRAALATMWNWNLWRSKWKLRKIHAIKISFLLWCQAYEVSTGGTPLHCLVGATGSWFFQWVKRTHSSPSLLVLEVGCPKECLVFDRSIGTTSLLLHTIIQAALYTYEKFAHMILYKSV